MRVFTIINSGSATAVDEPLSSVPVPPVKPYTFAVPTPFARPTPMMKREVVPAVSSPAAVIRTGTLKRVIWYFEEDDVVL